MGSDTAVAEPEEQLDEGAPVEGGAEATRTSKQLFAYSRHVHIGEDAAECEHRVDGKCVDPEHFHAWICLPNSIQHRDILDKARAAKARKKRSLRDSGSATRPASDAYVTLESDLDDMLTNPEAVIDEVASRKVKKLLPDRVAWVREHDERFENYAQDSEEWRRLSVMPEDERPQEEWAQLDREMDEFEAAVQERGEREAETERAALANMDPADLRETVRKARMEGEMSEAHVVAYYLWMGFICARKVDGHNGKLSASSATRYFETIDAYRSAPPEVINVIDETMRDLEGRLNRGEGAGN